MLTIELRFPAGRYHGTVWGRHVNEGQPEWPPSPHRLARALVSVARRRWPDLTDERLAAVLGLLAGPPRYHLPPTTSSHVRAYMSANDKDRSKKQKIFDAFVVLQPGARVLMQFPRAHPDPDATEDLDVLLHRMSYFGRGESWIMARVVPGREQGSLPGPNCVPLAEYRSDVSSDRLVDVACLVPPDEFTPIPKKRWGKKQKASADLFETWLGSLTADTKDIHLLRLNRPPTMSWHTMVLPPPARGSRTARSAAMSQALAGRFRLAAYTLDSTVLPRVLETVSVAERVRTYLMGIHKRVVGDPAAVSPRFSGKTPSGEPARGHTHVYYLPMDRDMDGKIDTVALVSKVHGFTADELEAIDGLRRIHQGDGKPELRLHLMELQEEPFPESARVWVSSTPFVTKRHHKKSRGPFFQWLEQEVRRECANHGLPEPSRVELPREDPNPRGHGLRPFEFMRSRKRERPMPGYWVRLEFDEPVPGPFALGALAHYGLGLFVPHPDSG